MVELTKELRCVPVRYGNQAGQIITPHGRVDQGAKMCASSPVTNAGKYTHLMVELTKELRCVPACHGNQSWQMYTPYGKS